MIEQVPNSPEAERALIGSVLLDPECFREIDIQTGDFYIQRHEWIWSTFQRMSLNNQAIDVTTVAENLDGKLEEIGGFAYLAVLLNRTVTSMHAETYASIVRDRARRRELLRIGSDMAKLAHDTEIDIQAEIPGLATRIVTTARDPGLTVHVSQVLSELYDEIEERSEDPREVYGLECGMGDLDRILAGFQKKELFLLVGKPGLGKSILGVQWGVGMAEHGHPGVVYEMEMGKLQTIRRCVSADSGIKTRAMRSGTLEPDDWSKLTHTIGKFEPLPLYISDSTTWTTASMRADLVRLKAMYGVEWFLVDYLQLLKDRYGKNDHERISYISKALKDICKDLDLVGIAINSMTKSGMEAGMPNLEDVRGSGQVSYDADVIVFLTEHKPKTGESKNENMTTLTFAKFREDDPKRYIHLVRREGFPAFAQEKKHPF
jgi:replicative DNA helicase